MSALQCLITLSFIWQDSSSIHKQTRICSSTGCHYYQPRGKETETQYLINASHIILLDLLVFGCLAMHLHLKSKLENLFKLQYNFSGPMLTFLSPILLKKLSVRTDCVQYMPGTFWEGLRKWGRWEPPEKNPSNGLDEYLPSLQMDYSYSVKWIWLEGNYFFNNC